MSSMFAAHVLYQGVMVVFLISFCHCLFFVGIEPSNIYLSLFRFLVVYMFGPLVLSSMYGLVVAMLFGTKRLVFCDTDYMDYNWTDDDGAIYSFLYKGSCE